MEIKKNRSVVVRKMKTDEPMIALYPMKIKKFILTTERRR